MKVSNALIGVMFLTGCSTVATVPPPEDYYRNSNNQSSQEIVSFGDAGNGMSEEDIQKVLSYRLALPPKNRIAILNLSASSYWSYYSSDFVHLNEETVKGLIEKLRESTRIYDASFLPSLLVPEKKTIERLRLAAARYQADVLLTYRTTCEDYQKYKYFNPNVTKSYCTVEAVAIDIRSGIVPFTAVSTNDYTAEKKEKDVNFEETRRKVEFKAIGDGLGEVASSLRKFIEGMPNL